MPFLNTDSGWYWLFHVYSWSLLFDLRDVESRRIVLAKVSQSL